MMAALATTAMTLGELLGSVPAEVSGVQVTDLVTDSRQVQPGAAFLAIQGERSHGLEYLEEAVRRGASVVLFEPNYEDKMDLALGVGDESSPSLAVPDLSNRLGEFAQKFYGLVERGPKLIGVTGTNGKSTVANLVAQAQTLRGNPCAYVGTLGAGIPPQLEPQELTTPDCLNLHKKLSSFKASYAALEISSHALDQDRIAGLKFDTAIFTNLTRDHLDYHGDISQYQAAKARLFHLEGLRHAVLFTDDPFGLTLMGGLTESINQIGVSMRSNDCLQGAVTDSGLGGITVQISGRLVKDGLGNSTDYAIKSPLIGDFNAENLLLALGALLSWDVPIREACEVLSCCKPLPGRMEVLGGGAHQPTVVIDYAHTPAGLERVLEGLRSFTDGDLWCVFGCGGERDIGKRASMGVIAARLADHITLTDDNPRGEDPGAIVADIRSEIIDHPDAWIEHDRARAIQQTVSRASNGDIVLVAGKGHEVWQWMAGERRAFSDQAVARAALGGQT